jgi:hypothetical protein
MIAEGRFGDHSLLRFSQSFFKTLAVPVAMGACPFPQKPRGLALPTPSVQN